MACQCTKPPEPESKDDAETKGQASAAKKTKLSRYREPNNEVAFFDLKNVQLTDERKTELINALIAVASSEYTKADIRTKALGMVFRLDALNKQAFIANEMLLKGKNPELPPGSEGDIKALVKSIWSFSNELKDSKEASEDDFTVAAYLMSLCTELEPEDMDLSYDLAVLLKEKSIPPVEWDIILYGISVPGTTPATGKEEGGKKLTKMQSKVKGLLVQSLEASNYAGKASQMNTAAEKIGSTREMQISFNQPVGKDMGIALTKVIKYLRLQHESLPTGYKVDISFEEQYIPKDGPSAAVACALMINSLIEGGDIDPNIAVTGDMNADGTVQPVGGITGKLRGAVKGGCDVIAIPESNSRVISDLLIINGISALTNIQIFSLKTFDDAWKLAAVHEKREPEIKESIELFSEILKVLNRPGGENLLRNEHVRTRLKKCLELTPNHLNAKILLVASMGRTPTKLSLLGSLENIDRAAEPLLRAIRQEKFNIKEPLDDDEYADSASAIKRLRPKLDDRTLKCADAMISYSMLMRRFVTNRPKSQNGIQKLVDEIVDAGQVISQEYDSLNSRVDVKEETMR